MYPSTEEEMQVVKVAFCEIAEILLRDVLNYVCSCAEGNL